MCVCGIGVARHKRHIAIYFNGIMCGCVKLVLTADIIRTKTHHLMSSQFSAFSSFSLHGKIHKKKKSYLIARLPCCKCVWKLHIFIYAPVNENEIRLAHLKSEQTRFIRVDIGLMRLFSFVFISYPHTPQMHIYVHITWYGVLNFFLHFIIKII